MSKSNVKFKLKGWKELRKTFSELKKGVRNRVAKSAVTAGARIVSKSTKSTAPIAKAGQTTEGLPVKRRLLRNSIGLRSKVARNRLGAYAVVGPRRKKFRIQIGTKKDGKAVFMNPTNYAHLMETGHHIVRHGRMIKYFPGTKFALRGFESSTSAAMGAIEQKFAEGIEREAIKARKL